MWGAITALLTSLLPMIIKLVVYFIDKKQDNDNLKREFLRFLTEIEKDVPVKIREKHLQQIERIKKQIEEKDAGK